jgi:hypothetical protein
VNYIKDPEGELVDWLGDLSQLPRPTKEWTRSGPKCGAEYRCADYPGVVIAHCGHPTAHRPYYFINFDTIRKVRLLADAQACVEAVMSGLIDIDCLDGTTRRG